MTAHPSIDAQSVAWDSWNAETREQHLGQVSVDQRDHVVAWLQRLGRTDLQIIDVGCGVGWLSPSLTPFGRVTATDFSAEVVARAQAKMPEVEFVCGDFMQLPFAQDSYDVVVSLEVLSHVADQPAFVAKLASILKPNSCLILATQNRPVLEKLNRVPPAQGWIRHWVDRAELSRLLAPHFDIVELKTITPRANRMPWRLVANNKVDGALHALFGDGPKRLKERLGWGWTLMVLARKRSPVVGVEGTRT